VTSRGGFRADWVLLDEYLPEPHVVPGPVQVRLTDRAGRTRLMTATQVRFTPLPEPKETR
jgi:hypothetical protein